MFRTTWKYRGSIDTQTHTDTCINTTWKQRGEPAGKRKGIIQSGRDERSRGGYEHNTIWHYVCVLICHNKIYYYV